MKLIILILLSIAINYKSFSQNIKYKDRLRVRWSKSDSLFKIDHGLKIKKLSKSIKNQLCNIDKITSLYIKPEDM